MPKFNLDAIIQKQDEGEKQKAQGGQPSKKRIKIEDNNNGIPVFRALCEGLEDVWKASKDIDNINIDTIELEIRLGMIIMDHDRRWRAQRPCDIYKEGACSTKQVPHIISSLEFKAGVDEIAIERIRRILNDKKRFNKVNKPIEKVRYDRDKDKNRWIVNEDGSMKKGENKTRFEKNDCALLAYEYDVRIDANFEIALTSDDDINNMKDFKVKCERIKRRTTYTSISNEFKSWKIDVTEVDSINFNDGGFPYGQSHEFELEFELIDRDVFKQSEIDNARAIIKDIGTQLFRLVNLFIPNDVATNPGKLIISSYYNHLLVSLTFII